LLTKRHVEGAVEHYEVEGSEDKKFLEKQPSAKKFVTKKEAFLGKTFSLDA